MRLSELEHQVDDLREDEPSWGLIETEMLVASGTGGEVLHRVQVVWVRRLDPDDTSADYQLVCQARDMGHRQFLPYPPLRIISFGDDTVGQMREEAAHVRATHNPLLNFAPDEQLIVDTITHIEEGREHFAHGKRTLFGAGMIPSVKQRT